MDRMGGCTATDLISVTDEEPLLVRRYFHGDDNCVTRIHHGIT